MKTINRIPKDLTQKELIYYNRGILDERKRILELIDKCEWFCYHGGDIELGGFDLETSIRRLKKQIEVDNGEEDIL